MATNPLEEIEIEVTQDDIDKGIPDNADSCAISRAATRALGVPARTGRFTLSANGESFNLPCRAVEFIRAFDQREAGLTGFWFLATRIHSWSTVI